MNYTCHHCETEYTTSGLCQGCLERPYLQRIKELGEENKRLKALIWSPETKAFAVGVQRVASPQELEREVGLRHRLSELHPYLEGRR